MTTKKSKKGKTMALTDFLADERKTVTVRATNWSEIVDNEEAESVPVVVDIGNLPTAPRGAVDIDYSTIPNTPPFVAHVANLSFEIDDEQLRRIFGDLNPKSARVMRDGARSRGLGLVEFETRENLIDALKKSDKEFNGRKIRVNVSDKTDSHQQEGSRGGFGGNRSNRGGGGEERPEMDTTWKRAEPRSNETFDNRSSSGFNRDRQNRGDNDRSHMGGGSRDNQQGNNYGFGYPRTRDDRGGPSAGGRDRDRDQNRQGQRNRYPDDNNRSNTEFDRPRYGGRFSDTRDTRDRNRNNDEPSERNRNTDDTRDNQQEGPRERQRLQLQPRTKPLEEQQPLSGSSSSVNNVAANAAQSSVLNPDESSSPTVNTSSLQTQDSSMNASRDEYQQQDSRDSTNNTSGVNLSEEQSTVKPSRGAGASIFGGAKPVDTAARELEIEKKLKELRTADNEVSADSEEKGSSSRPSYDRGGDREVYQGKRSLNSEDHHTRNRERDDGRSTGSREYHHRREYSGGKQFENEGRARDDDDDFQRRGGAQDRNRHGGPPRRDQDSGRTGNYNDHNQSQRDSDRGTAWTRKRDDRNSDANEANNHGRSSNNNNFSTESQPRYQQRGPARRTQPTEDDSNRLQLSNKFVMLDNNDLDDDDDAEKEEAQSPNIDD